MDALHEGHICAVSQRVERNIGNVFMSSDDVGHIGRIVECCYADQGWISKFVQQSMHTSSTGHIVYH